MPEAMFRLLLRFRDLIAETIPAHRDIIRDKGHCWWGWWGRPSEDGHRQSWSDFAEEIDREGDGWVGLFDSGKKHRVYKARVTSVRVRESLEDDELEKVPEYYRNSPYSKVWLRLESIVEIDAFFGEYSLEKAPRLPGIPPERRNRLEGKVIMDANELRSMDTTLWEVRPRLEDDLEEHFMTATFSFSEPVSHRGFQVHGDTILHLTDLHFARGDHRREHAWGFASETNHAPTMADSIAAAIRASGQKIGFVLVTGDLTFKASEGEFEEAARSLNLLRTHLDLDTDQVVVIPGNHDIAWADTLPDADESLIYAREKDTEAYRLFFRDFFKYDPDTHLSMGRRFWFPHGGTVEICALNSSTLAQNRHHLPGMGWVHAGAVASTTGELGWHDRQTGMSLRLLALHHHLAVPESYNHPDEFSKGFGMAADATGLMRQAVRRGVHLAIHGHRHVPFIWRTRVYDLPNEPGDEWDLGELSILGGGSAGSSSVRDGNYFNTISVQSDAITVSIFKSEKGFQKGFELMKRFSADIELERGLLTLGPWQKSETA